MRDRNCQQPSRAEHTKDLGQSGQIIWHVFQHLGQQNLVERAVLKWQVGTIAMYKSGRRPGLHRLVDLA